MRNPIWLMDLRQAKRIADLAQYKGVRLETFVELVLLTLGSKAETATMRFLLSPQLHWLLAGKPLSQAPYYEDYRESGESPLGRVWGFPQVEMRVEEFIFEAIEVATPHRVTQGSEVQGRRRLGSSGPNPYLIGGSPK